MHQRDSAIRKPFYRKQTQAWYIWEGTVSGRKCVRLSKDKDEAHRMWHERQMRTTPISMDMMVRPLLDQFLEWCKRQRSASTYQWYKFLLDTFPYGHLKVSDLRVAHVEDWLDDPAGPDRGQMRHQGYIPSTVEETDRVDEYLGKSQGSPEFSDFQVKGLRRTE